MLRAALYKKRAENPVFKNHPLIGSFQYINSFSWAHYPWPMTMFARNNPYVGTVDHALPTKHDSRAKERHTDNLAEIILIELHDIKDDWVDVSVQPVQPVQPV